MVDEGMVAVQGVAHRPVAVAAAEDHGEAGTAALELGGERERGHVLHERAGEPDDVRVLIEDLRGAAGNEIRRVDPHGMRLVHRDPAPLRVRAEPCDAPVGVRVEHTREDPVAEPVEDRVAAHLGVVGRAQCSVRPLQQEFRPAQRTVELVDLVEGPGAGQEGVQQADLERGQVDRLPGHGHQMDAHAVLPARPCSVRRAGRSTARHGASAPGVLSATPGADSRAVRTTAACRW